MPEPSKGVQVLNPLLNPHWEAFWGMVWEIAEELRRAKAASAEEGREPGQPSA